VLEAWGSFVHRHRWTVLVLSMLSSLTSLWLLTRGGRLDSGLVLDGTESGEALALMERELPRRPLGFDLILGHPSWPVTSAEFRAEVERALAPLRGHPRVATPQVSSAAGQSMSSGTRSLRLSAAISV